MAKFWRGQNKATACCTTWHVLSWSTMCATRTFSFNNRSTLQEHGSPHGGTKIVTIERSESTNLLQEWNKFPSRIHVHIESLWPIGFSLTTTIKHYYDKHKRDKYLYKFHYTKFCPTVIRTVRGLLALWSVTLYIGHAAGIAPPFPDRERRRTISSDCISDLRAAAITRTSINIFNRA